MGFLLFSVLMTIIASAVAVLCLSWPANVLRPIRRCDWAAADSRGSLLPIGRHVCRSPRRTHQRTSWDVSGAPAFLIQIKSEREVKKQMRLVVQQLGKSAWRIFRIDLNQILRLLVRSAEKVVCW